jgi:plasmid replication initiation protein
MARKKQNHQDRYLIRMQGGKRGLVEATSKMDIQEFRVFMTMLTLVLPEDVDFVEYEIRTTDIIRLFSLKKAGRLYESLRDAAERLFNKKFVILEKKEDGEIYKTTLHIIDETSEPIRESEQNRIRVRFNPKLKPYLLQLKKEYLTVDIRNITDIQSPYSIKLYFILKHQYNLGNRVVKYDVQRLREILAIEENEYPLYGNFKQRIIKKGISDLAEYTDLQITHFEEIKSGKSVETVGFHLDSKEAAFLTTGNATKKGRRKSKEAPLKIEKAETTDQEFDVFEYAESAPGISEAHPDFKKILDKVKMHVSEATVKSWFSNYPPDQIMKGVAYALDKIQKGKVKNSGAYLQKMVSMESLTVGEPKAKTLVRTKNQQNSATPANSRDVAKQIELLRMEAHQRYVDLFEQLVEREVEAGENIIGKLRQGLFGNYYKSHLSLHENLADPAVSGILVNIARELYPEAFISISPLESEISALEKNGHLP